MDDYGKSDRPVVPEKASNKSAARGDAGGKEATRGERAAGPQPPDAVPGAADPDAGACTTG